MSASVTPTPASSALPWWKEPTKDQWQAYIAAWLGWTLDAFDFTIFLLIMLPIFRTLLGIGMGAEWPAGAALAMESWPARSRGFMSGILQGSWGLGFALSAAAYGLLYDDIGWRGLLWIGILPALVVVWIRFYVKEPPVWAENKRQQIEKKTEVKAPLFVIFKRQHL